MIKKKQKSGKTQITQTTKVHQTYEVQTKYQPKEKQKRKSIGNISMEKLPSSPFFVCRYL
jgi:hypothetical protein